MPYKPVIAPGLVQGTPQRLVLPGGYTQSPFRPVLAGGLAQMSDSVPVPVAPLNNYTAGLTGAWSVARRLLGAYIGPLIRVRRASDNDELDVGFDEAGDLDTAALVTFAGGGTTHITTVYGQFGVLDMAQTSAAAQPFICNNAGVVFVNDVGYPVGLTEGTQRFVSSLGGNLGWPFSLFANSTGINDETFRVLWGFNLVGRFFGKTDTNVYYAQGGVLSTFAVGTINQITAYVLAMAAGADKISVDGAPPETGGVGDQATTTTEITWGDQSTAGAGWFGELCELVLYNAEKSDADLAAIQTALMLT